MAKIRLLSLLLRPSKGSKPPGELQTVGFDIMFSQSVDRDTTTMTTDKIAMETRELAIAVAVVVGVVAVAVVACCCCFLVSQSSTFEALILQA